MSDMTPMEASRSRRRVTRAMRRFSSEDWHASHALSTVTGSYIITEDGRPVGVTRSLDDLRAALGEVSYDQASKVRVTLVDPEEWGGDDITHLIAQDWFNGFESYEDWSADEGRKNGFVEFWFDEWSGVEAADYDRRYRKMQAARPAETRTLERMGI